MKKYNKTLDFVALALTASAKGNHELAARHFAKATQQPDFDHAIGVIEASNAQAFAAEQQAKVEARKVAAAKRLKAAEEAPEVVEPAPEEVVDDEEDLDLELGADLVSDEALEDELPQEELAGELDELDEPAEPEAPVVDVEELPEEDTTEAFARVLASMTRTARKAPPAKK